MTTINKQFWQNAMTYEQFRSLISNQVGNDSIPEQSSSYKEYIRMNFVRTKRLEKTVKLLPETQEFVDQQAVQATILVITETWCGDSAQIVYPIQKIVDESHGQLHCRYILRDDNLEIMDQFLTNGSRSIPIYLIMNPDTMQVMETFGPRPSTGAAIIATAKEKSKSLPTAEAEALMKSANKDLQLWYAKDKTVTIQQEFIAKLKSLS